MRYTSIQALLTYFAALVANPHTLQPCSSFLMNPTNNNVNQAYSYSPNALFSSSNPIEEESKEEKEARMKLVRQLQKSFYQDEIEEIKAPQKGSTIMEDVPLWRTQWSELPGYQNVLHVHVPHYTNMFQKILRSDAKSKYFGHLYLPGGSENLDNPEYQLKENTKAPLIGALMKITSHRELEDGRLILVVQALEKFRVVEAKRHHSPYSIADIEIIPDKELVHAQSVIELDVADDDSTDAVDVGTSADIADTTDATKGLSDAVAQAFDFHGFEFQPVLQDDQMNEAAVSPLVNYDIDFKGTNNNGKLNGKNKINNNQSTGMSPSISELEYKVWVHIDEMIHLLQSFVDPMKVRPIPIPTQILGLLPTNPIHPWPKQFCLEEYALKLEKEKAQIGTFTKSDFVRVDNHQGIQYPPLRRAQRLSFVLWALTDTIAIPDTTHADFSRQRLIELNSIEKRLDAGLRKLQVICFMIRNVLNQNKNRGR